MALNLVRPLSIGTTAVADSLGNVQFVFPVPAATEVWEGTLIAINAPSQAQFQATVGIIPWTAGNGPQPFGPVQILPGQTLTVTGSYIQPGTVLNCELVGAILDSNNFEAIYPNLQALPQGTYGPIAIRDTTTNLGSGGAHTYNFIDVRNWPSVLISLSCATQTWLQLSWSDTTSTQNPSPIFTEMFTFGPAGGQAIFPVKGKFLQIIVTNQAAFGANIALLVLPTALIGPKWIAGDTDLPLLDTQGITLNNSGAGNSATIEANYMYAGPVVFSFIRAVSAFKYQINTIDHTSTTHNVLIHDTSTGNSAANAEYYLNLPPQRLQLLIVNEVGGAGTGQFWATIQPTLPVN